MEKGLHCLGIDALGLMTAKKWAESLGVTGVAVQMPHKKCSSQARGETGLSRVYIISV